MRYKLRELLQWVRFGKIKSRVMDRIGYTVCEIEYRGRFNKLVGYWAYGYFDPELPYQGPTV